MGDTTAIEWTQSTWNPVTGCTKVSPGCDHCYAERVTERFHGRGSFERVVLHPERLDKPLRWSKPRKVFVNSMSDLFHDDVPEGFIGAVFEIMARAERHTFQILTKRHARMRAMLNRWATEGMVVDGGYLWAPHRPLGDSRWTAPLWTPPQNVWLGVSVEDQKWADIRIPALLDTPAAVRFLSCEPLLGPIDLGRALTQHTIGLNLDDCLRCCTVSEVHGGMGHPYIDPIGWVIVGGESGPGARPMHPYWARSIRDQCIAAGVPFFMKQTGAVLAREWALTSRAGSDPREWPEPFPQEYPCAT
jgi:protein gp37